MKLEYKSLDEIIIKKSQSWYRKSEAAAFLILVKNLIIQGLVDHSKTVQCVTIINLAFSRFNLKVTVII